MGGVVCVPWNVWGEERAGKAARRWVNDHVRPLSEQLARQTISRALNELDLHAFNLLQRVYKDSLELYPDIEKHWFFLRALDVQSSELPCVHEMTKKVLSAAKEVEAAVNTLSVGVADIDRLEEQQERLQSGQNLEEFFVPSYLFPTVFLGEISLFDGVSFGMTFDTDRRNQSPDQAKQEAQGNVLKLVYDTVENLIKLYNNNKNIKDLARAKREFEERKIHYPEYLQLAGTIVVERGTASLELTQRVQAQVTATYEDAQKLGRTLRGVLVFLIQRRDGLIDRYIEEKIQKEKDQFDARYYYPYLQGLDLTFRQEEQKLNEQLDSLHQRPDDPDYLEQAENLFIRKKALEKLRIQYHRFGREGRGS